MMRYLFFLTLAVASCAQSKADVDLILPGLLDLPIIEGSAQLKNCDYWFRDDSIYDLLSLEGESCLSAGDAEKGNELVFAYWNKLGVTGWGELNGGGNELSAYDQSRCMVASVALFPKNEPADSNWSDQDAFIIWIRVKKLKKCDD